MLDRPLLDDHALDSARRVEINPDYIAVTPLARRLFGAIGLALIRDGGIRRARAALGVDRCNQRRQLQILAVFAARIDAQGLGVLLRRAVAGAPVLRLGDARRVGLLRFGLGGRITAIRSKRVVLQVADADR